MATSYHFDLGNSNEGPVGFRARVIADTREEALSILQRRLEDLGQACMAFDGADGDGAREEYIEVYFNGENVTTDHIDSEEAPEET